MLWFSHTDNPIIAFRQPLPCLFIFCIWKYTMNQKTTSRYKAGRFRVTEKESPANGTVPLFTSNTNNFSFRRYSLSLNLTFDALSLRIPLTCLLYTLLHICDQQWLYWSLCHLMGVSRCIATRIHIHWIVAISSGSILLFVGLYFSIVIFHCES